ncbi:MAG: DUF2935 domain-containing protein [Bacillota bacterium]|nr:DUF2935 domain-containing protein [Bacillota bacterium]
MAYKIISNIFYSFFLNLVTNELFTYIQFFNPVHYHLLWLLDGVGHAASIASNLDMSEKMLIKTSTKFRKTFNDLYSKSKEMKGFQRAGLIKFPALTKLSMVSEVKKPDCDPGKPRIE